MTRSKKPGAGAVAHHSTIEPAARMLARFDAPLGAACSMVTNSQGWRRRAIAFFAGALSVLAMAPFFIAPILFLTLPVLVWLIDSAGTKRPVAAPDQPGPNVATRVRAAALDGWWFGFGYFLLGLYWIGEAFLVEAEIFGWLMPLAVTVMPAGLALFIALSTAAARAVWPQGLSRILVLAAAIAIGEWLRGHLFTGFPWNLFGYAFTFPLTLMQSVSLVGVYGLTLWVILTCATPLVVLRDAASNATSNARALLAALMISGAPLLVMYAFGSIQLAYNETTYVDGVKIRIVQPSVPQRDKWLNEKQSGIFADHLALSRLNENGGNDAMAGITHLIWPEASMPFLPLKHPYALQQIGELLPQSSHLIAGALRVEHAPDSSAQIPYDDAATTPKARPRVFNSLMTFDTLGKLTVLYDKTHLVPFGEYLPFRETLESVGLRSLTRLRGGFETGPTPRQTVDIPGLGPVGVLICYEAIFGGDVIQGPVRPTLLINLTNDGWFGTTTGPYQHFHKSRVRAVEEGLPLIRSANNGISAAIDPYGRVLARLDLDVRGTIDTPLPNPRASTLYANWKDSIFALNALVFLVVAGLLGVRRRPMVGRQTN